MKVDPLLLPYAQFCIAIYAWRIIPRQATTTDYLFYAQSS